MYNPKLVQPMRDELVKLGFSELTTPAEVDRALSDKTGTSLVVVNSVCGCAAGGARPGVTLAMSHSKKPAKLYTVFAGQDKEATAHARKFFTGMPPSSPSMVLFKEGILVHMIHRQDIEGHSPQDIATQLTAAFDKYCS